MLKRPSIMEELIQQIIDSRWETNTPALQNEVDGLRKTLNEEPPDDLREHLELEMTCRVLETIIEFKSKRNN